MIFLSISNLNRYNDANKLKQTSMSDIDNSYHSATSLRNYFKHDCILDWLQHHATKSRNTRGVYRRAIERCFNDQKNITEFTPYIMKQGNQFEAQVLDYINSQYPKKLVVLKSASVTDTVAAMRKGCPFISQPLVVDSTRKVFGHPDLLVRSDWLNKLIPTPTYPWPKEGSKFSKKWHYVVVDIKFTCLLLRADGIHLLNSGLFPCYKGQLCVYNWGLEQLQGYLPSTAYVLGRRWSYSSKGIDYKGDSCFDRYGVIDYGGIDSEYLIETQKAIDWLSQVKQPEAANWNVTKYPLDREELYPNMCNHYDFHWRTFKEEVAKHNKEITSIWMLGPKHRQKALAMGVSSWDRCTAHLVGINTDHTATIVDRIIGINQEDCSKVIKPGSIGYNFNDWKSPNKIEFYIDFETSGNSIIAGDDILHAEYDNVLSVVGVGYSKNGKWYYQRFVARILADEEEERLASNMYDYIQSICSKNRVRMSTVKCIHWSQAEPSIWRNILDKYPKVQAAWQRDSWVWLDLLEVFKKAKIVIKGCMSYKLKDVAAAMHDHGMISSFWNQEATCKDGRNAMVAAITCSNWAIENDTPMEHHPWMKDVIDYNEIDVKVLWEIIRYLRRNMCNKKRSRSGSPLSTGSPKRSKVM